VPVPMQSPEKWLLQGYSQLETSMKNVNVQALKVQS